ncbi:hypothetical protein TNCV_4467521 [Trichonephila clavipes]|nr:hypothetical protein TNCV_4467521 [Trichonephila clavipes]
MLSSWVAIFNVPECIYGCTFNRRRRGYNSRAEINSVSSRMLSSAERNYTVTERECLAVVWALNKFRKYLGSLPIKVITDHAALTRLTHGKNLSSRMIRWVLKLAEFNMEWEHRWNTKCGG